MSIQTSVCVVGEDRAAEQKLSRDRELHKPDKQVEPHPQLTVNGAPAEAAGAAP